jgi:hypothetical protein
LIVIPAGRVDERERSPPNPALLLVDCAALVHPTTALRLSTLRRHVAGMTIEARLFNRWIVRVKRSTVRCFDGFITTLIARKDEIANYFADRHNSGFVEGMNSKIKVIKRRCYGILNTEHLFQRISLDLFGYALYAPSIKGLQDA